MAGERGLNTILSCCGVPPRLKMLLHCFTVDLSDWPAQVIRLRPYRRGLAAGSQTGPLASVLGRHFEVANIHPPCPVLFFATEKIEPDFS